MRLSAVQIEERLEGIEQDMADRQDEFEQVAEDYHRTVREFDLRVARVKRQTKASTETAKKDAALDSIAAADDDLWTRFTDAEARYYALKAVMGTLEKRAMIGMALLKSHGREPSVIPAGPRAVGAAA